LETELAAARSRLRTVQRQFQDALDRFKLELGLPTDMPVTIDLAILKPFELIDPQLPEIEQKVKDYVHDWAKLNETDPDLDQLRDVTERLMQLRDTVEQQGFLLVESDFRRVRALFQEGTPGLDVGSQRRFESEEERRRVFQDVQNDERLYSNLQADFRAVSDELKKLRQMLSADAVPLKDRVEAVSRLADLREQLLKISQSLQVIQIGLRVELISVLPFELSAEQAVQLGLENRLDLMNARAAVMDARRKVEIAADKLEAVLDVKAEGDIRTPSGNEPFDFRGELSSFRAGFSLDAPLDLISERNDYRKALIEYQRARRAYIEFEDNVKLQIRQRWRQLQVSRQNFELSRQRVRIAALQYDSAVEEATAPVQQRGGRGGSGALNLLQALDAVLSAQNTLIADWISYERSRIQIYRDMGIMQIDANGVWLDEYYQRRAYGHESSPREDEGGDPRADLRDGRTVGDGPTARNDGDGRDGLQRRVEQGADGQAATPAAAVDADRGGGPRGGWHPRRPPSRQGPVRDPADGGRAGIRDGNGSPRTDADHRNGARASGEPEQRHAEVPS
ncbi:MAG: TolC family protein, partial [Planctomycetes bacterium]|nr:TolC family protein [Planctomycetota bacterium]